MIRGAGRLRARTRLPAEDVTALVNAVLVLLLPSGFIAVAWLLPEPDNTVTARVSSNFEYWTRNFFEVATVIIAFVPLSLAAAWRTRVYARRYMRGEGTGWWGVAEAGIRGFAL